MNIADQFEFFLWRNVGKAPRLIIRSWQNYNLKKLIAKALETSAYSELWKNIDLKPSRFSFEQLKNLPIVDKDFFRNQRLISYLVIDRPFAKRSVRYFCDSGGRSMKCLEDFNFSNRKNFRRRRHNESGGYAIPEFGSIAEKCPYAEGYHPYEESLILEVIDRRVVVTYFENHYMPFVRYDTGERGAYFAAGCDCGKPLFVPEIKADWQFEINNKIFSKNDFDSVFRFYFVLIDSYEAAAADGGILRIKIKSGRFWDDSLLVGLKKQIQELVDNEMEVKLEVISKND